MTTIFLLTLPLFVLIFWWAVFKPVSTNKFRSTGLKPGVKYTNKKGKHWTVNDRGYLEVTESMRDFMKNPKVQSDLQAMHRMFMRQTILALWDGRNPPHSVGGYGTLTKKKLIIEWNDEWQEEMDKLEQSYDINYNILFDIPEEHPPIGLILTAEEILAAYGSEEKEN